MFVRAVCYKTAFFLPADPLPRDLYQFALRQKLQRMSKVRFLNDATYWWNT